MRKKERERESEGFPAFEKVNDGGGAKNGAATDRKTSFSLGAPLSRPSCRCLQPSAQPVEVLCESEGVYGRLEERERKGRMTGASQNGLCLSSSCSLSRGHTLCSQVLLLLLTRS